MAGSASPTIHLLRFGLFELTFSSLLRCNRPRISISYSLPTLLSFQTKFPLAITSHSLSLPTFRFSTFLPSHSHNPAKRAPCSVSFTIVSNFSTLHSTTALSSPDTVPNFGFSRPKRECLNKYTTTSSIATHYTNLFKNAFKKNVLIITDETHIASLHAQAIHKAFKQLSIFQANHVYNADIKLVNFTATPDGIAANLSKWKFGHKTCIMNPPSNYISPFHLLDQGRVIQAKDLCGFDKDGTLKNADVYENIKEILQHIRIDSPKYHLIRTQNGALHLQTISNFQKVFQGYDFDFRSETKIPSLDDLMNIAPEKHTFIFIKEKLRCAKTVIKTHLGVLYERHVKNFNDSAVLQGFVGRLTGFHDNSSSVVFSNIPSIHKYKLFWQQQFSYNAILYDDHKIPKWNSISTIHKPPHAKISAFFAF